MTDILMVTIIVIPNRNRNFNFNVIHHSLKPNMIVDIAPTHVPPPHHPPQSSLAQYYYYLACQLYQASQPRSPTMPIAHHSHQNPSSS
mmetsp:Transcript_2024/g.3624  ORF Transcript_2024/g.3624 Transcript_2024/m.3624 type:complete len:88 (-) Transcript_2024:63-326(-)